MFRETNPFAVRSVEMIDTKTRLSEFGIEFADSLFLCLKCVIHRINASAQAPSFPPSGL